MSASGKLRVALCDAIASAFTYDELSRLTLIVFDRHIERISLEKKLDSIVLDIIKTAEAENEIMNLAARSARMKPADSNLQAAARAIPGVPELLDRIAEESTRLAASIEAKIEDWLDEHRRLTSNVLTAAADVRLTLGELHVPTDVAERRKQEDRKDVEAHKGSSLFDPEKPSAKDSKGPPKRFSQDTFFEEVLRKGQSPQSRGRRIALVGGPGVGKTTLLQTIASWVNKERLGWPVWISVPSWKESRRTLREYVVDNYLPDLLQAPAASESEREALVTTFQKGDGWILLDGVDETDEKPSQILAFIRDELRAWLKPARVILACRINVWDAGKNSLEGFDPYRCLEFGYGDGTTTDQVGQFIQGWFRTTPEFGERLRTELDRPGRERIKDQSRNPLRLALLCMIWQQYPGGGLPGTRAALFEQYHEAFYRWKEDLCPTTEAERQQLDGALSRLALRALEQARSRFRIRHRLVVAELGGPGEPLFDRALRVGWLVRIGIASEEPREQVYAFFHPVFQEYFACRAIADGHSFLDHVADDLEKGCYRAFEPQWREVMLLWFGREDVPEEEKNDLLAALAQFEDGCGHHYFYRAQFLAGAAVSQFPAAADREWFVLRLLDIAVGQLIRADGKDEWCRFLDHIAESACEALRETDAELALGFLLVILDDLVGNFDLGVSDHVMAALRALAPALSQTGEDAATWRKVLLSLATSGPEDDIRRQWLDLLTTLPRGEQPTIDGLIEALSLLKSGQMFAETVAVLKKIGGAIQLARGLAKAARPSGVPAVRARALLELALLSPIVADASACLDDLLKKTPFDRETMRALVDDTNTWGKMRDERILRLIIRELRACRDGEQLSRSVKALAGTGAQGAAAFLNELLDQAINGTLLLDDTKPTAREWIQLATAEALASIEPGDRRSRETLLSLIKTTRPPLEATVQSPHVPAVRDPRTDVTREVRRIRRGAVEAFARTGEGDPDTRVLLQGFLRTETDSSVRCALAATLLESNRDDREALAALLDILPLSQDPYWSVEEVSFLAANALKRFLPGHPEVVAVAVELCRKARTVEAKQYAVSILEQIAVGSEIARDYLVEIFEAASDDELRRHVCSALAQVAPGSSQHESVLLRGIADEGLRDSILRNFTSYGMKSAEVLNSLRRFVRDAPSRSPPFDAIEALGWAAEGDPESVALLTRLLTTEHGHHLLYRLRHLVLANARVDQMPQIVEVLAPFAEKPETEEDGDRVRFSAWHQVLWRCSENLPYPVFASAFRKSSAVAAERHDHP